MQGSKKPPTSEVVESSKTDWRDERNSRPPGAVRRDDRAEPDDDEAASSSRIDVVNVDVGSRSDNAASGLVNLRRELAKLHQQAALVEKSLEDQRRDRSDSADRLERATERANQLEARVAALEAEARSLRSLNETANAELRDAKAERDDLAMAVETAKLATSELGKLRLEVDQLRVGAEAAKRMSAELAAAKEEAARATAEAKQAKIDGDKAREAVRVAEEDAAMVGDQASKIREEAAQTRAEADKARDELAKARDEATKAREEAAKTREEITKLGEQLAKTRDDLTKAKFDNTRDRETARDRIDLLDRALEDARAASLRSESELEKSRRNEEQLARQVEVAVAAAAQAEAHAAATATAHASLESSVRRLREEITGAFARVGNVVPAAGVAPGSQVPPPPESSVPSSPASKSVPPPAPASVAPPRGSVPPLTYASVPPQVHTSDAPVRVPVTQTAALVLRQATVPPPANHEGPPPSSKKTLPPPLGGASMPPPPMGSTQAAGTPLDDALPPSGGWHDSAPPTRRPASVMPPAADLGGTDREALLAKLVDPDQSEGAISELKHHPEWLRSLPPPTFVAALASVDYNHDAPVFELARAWDREPLCHALIASLRGESDGRTREHSAWLLKHLAAPSSWKAIADLAQSNDEPSQLRRWLLEGLDRLAAGRAIGWPELGELVTALAHHPDASLRDGVVGILVSLDRSDEKRKLLMDILRTDDDEVVLASAVNALASVLPMDLDPAVTERLLGHPSPHVQRSVKEMIERMKHAKP